MSTSQDRPPSDSGCWETSTATCTPPCIRPTMCIDCYRCRIVRYCYARIVTMVTSTTNGRVVRHPWNEVMWMGSSAVWSLALATFVAAVVEMVEALTIVLAMGMTRSWRSTLWGVGAALVALAGFTAVTGYALATWLPEAALQLVIGGLLLIFGLQWLRKAVLRSSGRKALHDEALIFEEQRQEALAASCAKRFGLDWFSFV